MGPTTLAAVTLALFAVGGVAAATVWTRRGGAFAGLVGVFVLGFLRQAAVLWSALWSAPGTKPQPADWITECAFLGLAACAIAVLRALHRTTRERDRAEDLHWDSMETVRHVSLVAGHGGEDLATRVARVLAIGVERFGLERGVVWLEDEDGVRMPGPDGVDAASLPASLEALLRRAAEGSRPVRVDLDASDRGDARVLFAAPLSREGDRRGALAFFGDPGEESKTRFGATDKDLLELMAAMLGDALAPLAGREDAEADIARAPATRPRARPARSGPPDLEQAVRLAERRLRRAIGADATLSVALDPTLPALRPAGVALPRLVEALVLAAARLAPTGRIALETRSPRRDSDAPAAAGGDVTLTVRVEDASLEASALEQLFAPTGDPAEAVSLEHGIPLSQLERRLRSAGGDLSVSLESGRCAVLTAYLPVAAPTGPRPALRAGPQSV